MTRIKITIFILLFSCNSETRKQEADNCGKRLLAERLHKVKVDVLNDSVYIGTLQVYEDRASKGRKLDLHVLVMPSINTKEILSPIFHLEGGPGSGASSAASYYEAFPDLRQNRDIVFVDFRGTGKSSPLRCKPFLYNAENSQEALDDMFPVEKVKQCYDELENQVDLTQYTTTNAIEDIEEVRQWLGYNKINLIGFSYGTRACQSYLRQFPHSIRSVIMYGAAPTFMHRPESFAKDAQRSLQLLYSDCAKDSLCSSHYPNLKNEFDNILASLSREPIQVNYKTANKEIELTIRKGMFCEIIRTIMYSTDGQRKLPYIIHQAYLGNFNPIIDRAILRSVNYDEISDAFYLCITCSEDIPFIDTLNIGENTENTFLENYRISQEMNACRRWIRHELSANYLDPVETNTPVLVISGDRDPVAPPRWGVAMSQRMSKAQHVIINYASHSEYGLQNIECLPRSFSKFYTNPDTIFNASCISEMSPNKFYISQIK